MSIDPNRVVDAYGECLAEDLDPEDANYMVVEGILAPTAFDKRKLEAHRDEVIDMLSWLPLPYRPLGVGGGGGWSFLNACQDKDDHQWTGLHRTMDQLFQLGIGLGMATWILDREMWAAFPGGMPYVSVTLPSDLVSHE